ncbi:MAG TPA: helix-turn-helix transcriptional regulator, partial [Candidatus Rubrimentiphilum sp.]|nr:helix-turn-helix transcriptional regulator [Candidatus Rubrimentiphilum sp.]
KTSVLPGISYSEDPRTRAFAEYSNGIALLELGDIEAAIAMLEDAREIFEGHHYGWRAALCAVGLYRATSDEKWLVEARRDVGPWPRSWIAREIAETSERASDRGLSKAQRRVLDLLVNGKSNADIAKTLGRSPYTVRNHIAQLFRTYNVSNRTQLAALFKHRSKI